MKFVIFCTAALCLLLPDGTAAGKLPMTDDEMYNCYYVIVCDLRKPEEFRRLITAAGPELLESAMGWFRDISRMPDAEDSPEFWAGYPDRKCAYDEPTRKDMFNQWIAKIGEFWARVCQEGNDEECKKMEDAADVLAAIMAEYTASGDCVPGKRAMQGAKGAGEEAMSSLPSMG